MSAQQTLGHVYFGNIGDEEEEEPLKVALVRCSKGSSDQHSLSIHNYVRKQNKRYMTIRLRVKIKSPPLRLHTHMNL